MALHWAAASLLLCIANYGPITRVLGCTARLGMSQTKWYPCSSEKTLLASDWILWWFTLLLEAVVVYLLIIQGLFHKFLFLGLYFLLSLTTSIGLCVDYYLRPPRVSYRNLCVIAAALLAAYLFLSICEVTARGVGRKVWWRRVILWNAGALLATTCFSFLDPFSAQPFVAEFLRNILFGIGLVLLVAWAWKNRSSAESPIAARLVGVMGVYFSLFFVLYGAKGLAASAYQSSMLLKMSTLISAWLPVGCGFALASYQPPRHKSLKF